MGSPKVEIDLATVTARADAVHGVLRDLCRCYDLTRFTFTDRVRIAPTEVPHSHPILTLNTYTTEPHALLSVYLHEQMHWYLDLCATDAVARTLPILRARYPGAPDAASERARDEMSVYLHLVVNWLEIEAASQVIGAEAARAVHANPLVYPWGYATVISDWSALEALYQETGVLPLQDAREAMRAAS
ncbi:MAG: hypothetical protein AAFV19_17070 [Pseudomonadota bacterium]